VNLRAFSSCPSYVMRTRFFI